MDIENQSQDSLRRLQEHVVSATIALFEGFGIVLESRGAGAEMPARAGDETLVSAVIGYASETLRGALVLLGSSRAVSQWHVGVASVPLSGSDRVSDTLGEFSNMLLGRLKYLLLHDGVSLLMATPSMAMGAGLTLPKPSGTWSTWMRFESSAGPLDVRLDATVAPNFQLRPRMSSDPPVSAGDMLLF